MSSSVWRRADGPAVSEERVAEIERQLNVKLPDSLLNVVRMGDGMRPHGELIVERATDEGRVLDALTAILPFADQSLLQSQSSLISDHVSKNLEALMEREKDADAKVLEQFAQNQAKDLRWVIPIADNGDGWICLDYRGDPNRIAYRVVGYSLTPVDGADRDGFGAIAETFEELVTMLRNG